MDPTKRQLLFEKNQKIIDMVIERAARDFADDIAIIGLTGSFSTGDFHEKSDLDLIIINNTQQGWEISTCFILDDVGYDIYCTPWETRIEDQATLSSPMVSCLLDLEILYCAKPEYLEKFNSYKNRALATLAKPIGKDCLERAKKQIDMAKQDYVDCLLTENLNSVRYAAAKVLSNLTNALVTMNNTYFKRGIKRYLEEISTYTYKPVDFEQKYMAVIEAETIHTTRQAAFDMLESIVAFYDEMRKKFTEKPAPTYDNLAGTYEELWCNYRNKVSVSIAQNDQSYAFHVAMGAQEFLDEMAETNGTKKLELMKHYDANHLPSFKDAFFRLMDEYLEEYIQVGRTVNRYNSFEALYAQFMKSDPTAISCDDALLS